jgi:hypothetical protein
VRFWIPIACLPLVAVVAALAMARPIVRVPASECYVPPLECRARCGELVWVTPIAGRGYEDDPVPSEREAPRSTSWLRRDLFMLVRHAAARVACATGGHPIALGDMSERDGATPGTAAGAARHPPGAHVGGYDIDLAYYQRGRRHNRINPICPHLIDGIDQYHCVGPPARLDVQRTALFIGTLFESSGVRIVGVDGRAGPLLRAEITALCIAGTLSPVACGRIRLGYENVNFGRGWFFFHHAHMHVSWQATLD